MIREAVITDRLLDDGSAIASMTAGFGDVPLARCESRIVEFENALAPDMPIMLFDDEYVVVPRIRIPVMDLVRRKWPTLFQRRDQLELAEPVAIVGDALVISVESAAIAEQLAFLDTVIIDAVSTIAPIRRLRFRVRAMAA